MSEAEKTIFGWIDMWRDIGIHPGDVAFAVIRAIAESGEGELFHLLPEPIQVAVRQDVAQFLADGKMEVTASGTTTWTDISARMQRFIEVLRESGIDLVWP